MSLKNNTVVFFTNQSRI